jgi:hypothetical protein
MYRLGQAWSSPFSILKTKDAEAEMAKARDQNPDNVILVAEPPIGTPHTTILTKRSSTKSDDKEPRYIGRILRLTDIC